LETCASSIALTIPAKGHHSLMTPIDWKHGGMGMGLIHEVLGHH
jgi:hypothetical protein